MAERSNAAVLGEASCGPEGSCGKTVEVKASGGSAKHPAGNPSLRQLPSSENQKRVFLTASPKREAGFLFYFSQGQFFPIGQLAPNPFKRAILKISQPDMAPYDLYYPNT